MFEDFLSRLDTSLRGPDVPVIVMEDFNAKSPTLDQEDRKGHVLVNWMSSEESLSRGQT